ncbi:60S ribosomal subunit biogenesis [Komagataella phaffii CBS 7435]|uniref:Ribosome biogenesis protein NOP53 n=2 Tax=Komagataella phaffii TaxID=460519 RepID=C4R5X5_KOMPG|nr:Nucleolar protein [Komagataella phaffii GS115]AOA63757.1 GQ67_04028T0 [Komagataella phaffii]CAH2449224.1 60S ribosomal subunit biogenesis [Komagataella phaffii CBS 7435]AOA69061.1 GQ68_04001T0 [Komagataella phaffii GS115]CAY70961.1 Nucleolar protein [Komagataella phaffii GS115]CCA39240.1 60S ribosomal subunit biogenesis [Komagataella phaffii CBS 7435]
MSEAGTFKKNHSSRKGKRAWRKNIDLEDVEKGLEESRENDIQYGGNPEEMDLFTVDTSGSEQIRKKRNIPPLKSRQILEQRSKVPALDSGKRNRKPVPQQQVRRLMSLAGRTVGKSKTVALIERDGVIKTGKSLELWGSEPEEEVKKPYLPEADPPTRPETLNLPPVRVATLEDVPHAGKSYNPAVDSWKDLIEKEFFREKKVEDQLIALDEHKTLIKNMMVALEEEEEPDQVDQEEDEDSEGEKSNRSDVPEKIVHKKKTRVQRNSIKREKAMLQLEEELQQIQKKMDQIDQLDKIEKELLLEKSKPKATKARKTKSKHDAVLPERVEVKLSSELTDSLRKLKPEGNLAYDQMRALQATGVIETAQKKKEGKEPWVKVIEKASYAEFK